MDSLQLTWEELFLEFDSWMYAYAKSRYRGQMDRAEDLVQETILRVLKCPRKPGDLRSPRAYVITTMQSAFNDGLKKSMRAPLESLDDQNVGLQKNLVSQSEVQRNLERQELLNAIRQEMARLSPRERRLLELLLEGKTPEEISEILEEDVRIIRVDVNALKSKLRYRLRDKDK
jgi:RNA polymerase sigma factor (sigma-70 family)